MTSTCPHCHQQMPVAYKKLLRKNMLRPLAVLAMNEHPLTTQEFAALFEDEPELRIEITKHLASLKLWRLIEETEREHYRVTVRGMKFVDGNEPIPEWVWTVQNQVVSSPDGEPSAPLKFAYEIEPSAFSEPRARPTSLPVQRPFDEFLREAFDISSL